MPYSAQKLVPVLMLLPACGSSAEKPDNKAVEEPSEVADAGPQVPCTVESAVASRFDDPQGVVDCGVLMPPNTSEQSAAAQKCVLDAMAAQKPFSFVHYQAGPDSKTAEGLVGDGSGTFTIFSYDSDPGGKGQGAKVTVHGCGSFAPYADCMPTPGFACLECIQPGHTDLWCHDSE